MIYIRLSVIISSAFLVSSTHNIVSVHRGSLKINIFHQKTLVVNWIAKVSGVIGDRDVQIVWQLFSYKQIAHSLIVEIGRFSLVKRQTPYFKKAYSIIVWWSTETERVSNSIYCSMAAVQMSGVLFNNIENYMLEERRKERSNTTKDMKWHRSKCSKVKVTKLLRTNIAKL